MPTIPVFSATQLKNQTGTVLDRAMRGPVKLTSHGRARVYLVPAEIFERLLALEDAALARRAKAAKARGMVGSETSLALLKGMKDAGRRPVAGRGKSAATAAAQSPRPGRKQAAGTKKRSAAG